MFAAAEHAQVPTHVHPNFAQSTDCPLPNTKPAADVVITIRESFPFASLLKSPISTFHDLALAALIAGDAAGACTLAECERPRKPEEEHNLHEDSINLLRKRCAATIAHTNRLDGISRCLRNPVEKRGQPMATNNIVHLTSVSSPAGKSAVVGASRLERGRQGW